MARIAANFKTEVRLSGSRAGEDLTASSTFFGDVLNLLADPNNEGHFLKNSLVFSFSFCQAESEMIEKDGLLSQWMSYGKGGGIAIEFDAAELARRLD